MTLTPNAGQITDDPGIQEIHLGCPGNPLTEIGVERREQVDNAPGRVRVRPGAVPDF
jgi:hypothetical protein